MSNMTDTVKSSGGRQHVAGHIVRIVRNQNGQLVVHVTGREGQSERGRRVGQVRTGPRELGEGALRDVDEQDLGVVVGSRSDQRRSFDRCHCAVERHLRSAT